MLPREVRVATPEVAVGRGLLEDRAAQVEVTPDGRGTEVEHGIDGIGDLHRIDRMRAKRLDEQRHRSGDADRIGNLDLTTLGRARGNDVLRHPTRGVGGGAIDLRRVLARERAAAVAGRAAVGVDDDLAAGEAGVGMRTAEHEVAGRVRQEPVVVAAELLGDHRLHDVLEEVVTELTLKVDARRVLRGDEHRLEPDRAAVLVVEGDLRLAVGPQVGHRAVLAHSRQALGETVREPDGQWHEVGRLVVRVAEHHPLIAGTLAVEVGVDVVLGADFEGLVDTHGDVGRLLVDRRDHAAGVAVEALVRMVVADGVHGLADQLRDVDIGRGGDLTGHDDEPGGEEGLAGHSGHRVRGEDRVQHRVGHLVRHLVRMAFRDGFRCEGPIGHGANPF